jgi:sulfite reductase (NADPH) hemoprotein beta-component
MARMIIANRLTDGLVVFFRSAGDWTVEITDGLVIGADDDEERVLSTAKTDEDRCLVVDPNLIDVTVDGPTRKPVALREAIRAFGPTV